MQDYRNLIVWQKAMAAAEACLTATETLPDQHRFGLRSQMDKAAVSIASNIAEGCGRDSDREFARFARIAYGSTCELETQTLLALRTGLGEPQALAVVLSEARELRPMLGRLIARLSADSES